MMRAAVASPWRERRMRRQSQSLIYPDLNFTQMFDVLNIDSFGVGRTCSLHAFTAIPTFYLGCGMRKTHADAMMVSISMMRAAVASPWRERRMRRQS